MARMVCLSRRDMTVYFIFDDIIHLTHFQISHLTDVCSPQIT
jgi:hypothetical protein